MVTALRVPEGVDFHDLRLARRPDGDVSFDWAPLDAICAASGVDGEAVRQSAGLVSSLIIGWYRAHRAHGGEPDPVAEDLIAEAEAEDRLGSGVSLPPGRA